MIDERVIQLFQSMQIYIYNLVIIPIFFVNLLPVDMLNLRSRSVSVDQYRHPGILFGFGSWCRLHLYFHLTLRMRLGYNLSLKGL